MLLHDKTHSEEFAYEDYETTPGIAGNWSINFLYRTYLYDDL
jgi:hypothetical protein